MKPIDHKRLTRISLNLFDYYSPDGLRDDSADIRNKIVSGAAAEDNMSFERARNWHFFKENNQIADITVGPLVLVKRTSEKVLEKKIATMAALIKKQGAKSERAFVLLGGILHHVQDMSTPAHAVPVYHDPLMKDSFEEYSEKELAREGLLKKLEMPAADYEAVMTEPVAQDAMEIYQTSARNTLKKIFNMTPSFAFNGNRQTEANLWAYFWIKYDPAAKSGKNDNPPGFGHYGPLGKHFGKSKITLGRNVYAVDPAIYSDFHAYVSRKIIRDSLRVLKWFEEKIAGGNIC